MNEDVVLLRFKIALSSAMRLNLTGEIIVTLERGTPITLTSKATERLLASDCEPRLGEKR